MILVPSHRDIPGNCEADELAGKEIVLTTANLGFLWSFYYLQQQIRALDQSLLEILRKTIFLLVLFELNLKLRNGNLKLSALNHIFGIFWDRFAVLMAPWRLMAIISLLRRQEMWITRYSCLSRINYSRLHNQLYIYESKIHLSHIKVASWSDFRLNSSVFRFWGSLLL